MTIRLLVNENFPAPSVAPLRSRGLDVLSVTEHQAGQTDAEVLALAVRENRWLITFDRDYGELIFRRGLPAPPAVILLRAPSYRPAGPAEWVLSLAADPSAIVGKFTVFDGFSIRSRALRRPIGNGND